MRPINNIDELHSTESKKHQHPRNRGKKKAAAHNFGIAVYHHSAVAASLAISHIKTGVSRNKIKKTIQTVKGLINKRTYTVKRTAILNPEHMITYDALSPQEKAQHEFSIIQRFLKTGFEGEYIFKQDQEIIDKFMSLENETEKTKMLKELEKVAYTFH